MNKFEKLIFEGKYDQLLEETKEMNNLDEAYSRFKVLVMIEEYKEALDIISKFKKDFIFTLKRRKELFVLLKEIIDINTVINIQNLVMDGKITPSY